MIIEVKRLDTEKRSKSGQPLLTFLNFDPCIPGLAEIWQDVRLYVRSHESLKNKAPLAYLPRVGNEESSTFKLPTCRGGLLWNLKPTRLGLLQRHPWSDYQKTSTYQVRTYPFWKFYFRHTLSRGKTSSFSCSYWWYISQLTNPIKQIQTQHVFTKAMFRGCTIVSIWVIKICTIELSWLFGACASKNSIQFDVTDFWISTLVSSCRWGYKLRIVHAHCFHKAVAWTAFPW